MKKKYYTTNKTVTDFELNYTKKVHLKLTLVSKSCFKSLIGTENCINFSNPSLMCVFEIVFSCP